jgi:hypothetical protein
MHFAVPLQFVIEAASPEHAAQQTARAKQLLTDPMIVTMLQAQGLAVAKVWVGDPKAVRA